MKNKFMLVLKNPPSSIMVDNYENYLKDDQVVKFTEDGLLLVVPISVDWNIAYIKELSPEEVRDLVTYNEKQKEAIRKKMSSLITPTLKIPKGKPN